MYKLVCALFLPVAAGAQMQVWAAGDWFRINPHDGKAFEANSLVFPDAPTGDYRQSSPIWDSARKQISLQAARNEIISFQLIVERGGQAPLTGVNVQLGDLTGPGGVHLPKDNLDLYKEWYVNIRHRSAQDYSLGTGWYPDALIPVTHWKGRLFPKSYMMPFTIPDPLNNIGPAQQNQAIWVDIYIPKQRTQAPPGAYHTTITVSSKSGDRAELSLRLGVWDFALPEETHIAGNIHTDTELNNFAPDLELRYYQMIRRHRLAMGVLGYAPDTTVNGSDIQFDWTSYDARLGRYLDGSAFTEKYGYHGPGTGVPIEMLILPFDVYPTNDYFDSRHIGYPYGKEWKFYRPWPDDLPESGITPEYTAVWKKAFQAFQKHFDDHPAWNRTKPIVFLLSLDESYDNPSVEKMLYFGQLLKESGAHRLKFRVDGSYPMDTMDRLAGVVDISILGVRSYVPERVRQLRQKGVEDWFYTGMGITDADPLGCRALGWVSWKYQARSWSIWEFDFNSLRAWMYPETYLESNGDVMNGLGFLIYRGETMGLEEPVASIRLKLLRRGSQDYEYFWLLAQKKGGRALADQAANQIIHEPLGTNGAWGSPGMWSHNADQWEAQRRHLGDLIEKMP